MNKTEYASFETGPDLAGTNLPDNGADGNNAAGRSRHIPIKRPLTNQVGIVGAGTLLVTLLTLLVTRIYSQRFGPSELSVILLFRQYGSVLVAVAALGMPIALQRNVAFLINMPRRAGTAAVAGLGIVSLSMGTACLVASLFSGKVAQMVNWAPAAAIWPPFAALIFAQLIATTVSLIHLARGNVVRSTLLTVFAFGAAPLIALCLFPFSNLNVVLSFSAVLAAGFTAPMLVQIFSWANSSGIANVRHEGKTLLQYGVPRLLASLLEPAADMVVPLFALHSGAGLRNAGYLAIGMALLRPLNPLTSALNQVMIPASARKASGDPQYNLAIQPVELSKAACHVGLFAAVQLVIWCDVLIRLWVGPGFEGAVRPARLILLSIVPAFIYGSMRGVIDGAHVKPVNSYNLSFSFIVLLISGLLVKDMGILALAGAYLAAKLVLGGLTIWSVFAGEAASVGELDIPFALLIAMLLGAAAVLLRMKLSGIPEAASMPVAALLSFAIFVFLLHKRKIYWASLVAKKVRLAA